MDTTVEFDLERAQELAHVAIEAASQQEGLAPNGFAETPRQAADIMSHEPGAAVAGAMVLALQVGLQRLFGERLQDIRVQTSMLEGGDLPPSSNA